MTDASQSQRRKAAKTVQLNGTKSGLGIKIVGGRNVNNPEKDFGIYIKEIVPGYLAERNGGLLPGDQLLEANNTSLVGVSNEKAVEILRSCAASDSITLLVARDQIAQSEFRRLSTSMYSTPAPPVASAQITPIAEESAPPLQQLEGDDNVTGNDNESYSTISYTSDSSGAEREEGVMRSVQLDDVKVTLPAGYNRPLSAISTTSDGPPPPLPASSPPEDFDSFSPLKREPTQAEHNLSLIGSEVANIAAKRKGLMSSEDTVKFDIPPTTESAAFPQLKSVDQKPPQAVWKEKVSPPVMTEVPTSSLLSSLDAHSTAAYFKPPPPPASDEMSELKSTTEDSSAVTKRTKKSTPTQQYTDKRLSANPSKKYKFDKLIFALRYIGCDITPQQQAELRESLHVDMDDKVNFGEFLKAAQDLNSKVKHMQTQLIEALQENSLTAHSYIPKPAPALPPFTTSPLSSSPASQPIPEDIGLQDHKDEQEPETLKQQIPKFESQLSERGAQLVKDAAWENQVKQLESKVRQLEKEKEELNEKLKKKNKDEKKVTQQIHQPDLTNSDLHKKLAVMDCELKKKKATIHRYEVVTEKLRQFVQNCHDVLANSPNQPVFHPQGKGESVIRGDSVRGNPRPPLYLAKHARKTGTTLAQEANETLIAVRQILVQELPEGYEEAYDDKGQKYYIDHGKQSTARSLHQLQHF